MKEFYVPVLIIVPEIGTVDEKEGSFGLILRKWDVSIFDLATLATNHKLHISYELMGIFLRQCNMEFVISASSLEELQSKAKILKAALYINGLSPFIYPYASSHSLNEYAGINSRDSELLRDKLPEGLRSGLISKDVTVEVWPFELTLQTILGGNQSISNGLFSKAATDAETWEIMIRQFPVLSTVQNALVTAPMIQDIGQSLLHIWTAIESVFPKVNQEVSFRLALYLSQLSKHEKGRYEYFNYIKKAYGVRSKVAHGGNPNITIDAWMNAWNLLLDLCLSILHRKRLPEEDDLLREILS